MSNKPNDKLNRQTPNMSQKTKYAISIVELLILITIGYAGLTIYENKHNHNGSNLFASLFGRNKPKLTNDSAYAQQNIKLQQQYSTNKIAVNPSTINENVRRQAIFNFFTAYLNNKTNQQSQGAVIDQYGTANLANQLKTAQVGYDPFTCAAEGAMSSPVSFTIGEKAVDSSYTVDFRDSKNPVSTSQVLAIDQGNVSLVDSVACLLSS